MFRYTIALDISFSGQVPTITQDDIDDMPLYGRVRITIGPQVQIDSVGGSMVLPTGSTITGTVVNKQIIEEQPHPAG